MAESGWCVLVVDDEPNNLKLMRQVLAGKYRLAFATTGPMALEIVPTVRPDLILLDVMMPGMDGYEVCRHLKDDPTTRDIPVIFVTAKSDESDESTGFAAGAVDYITKPFRPLIVQARVKNHLELKQARESLRRQNEILEQRVEERTREVLNLQQKEFELRRAKERIENELAIAAQIQKSILPSDFPAFPQRTEFDLYAAMAPAREVGGDFYDFFFVDDDHLALIIADAAGKGVPAALFVMRSRTVLRSVAKLGQRPADVLAAANDLISERNETGMFITVFLGYYHFPSGRLVYANGGHLPPFIVCVDGTRRQLDQKHGSGLGVMPGSRFGEDVVSLALGDTLWLYTDGVTEARSPQKEFFGLQRFMNLASDCQASSLSEQCRRIVGGLSAFQHHRQFDDMTVLALRRDV
jgi:sigma-B regulation protein RsbU (phosphoserine phosphatase)